jgi:hypothetical protein
MNANEKQTGWHDMKARLSVLWIFAILNYLYADVLGLHDAAVIEVVLSGSVGGIEFTPGFMLGAALLMETAMVMVPLSLLLPYRANRWANIIVGVIHTTAVFSSMFVGTAPELYYLFFGTIEITTTLLIIWFAWRWPNPEKRINSAALNQVKLGSNS